MSGFGNVSQREFVLQQLVELCLALASMGSNDAAGGVTVKKVACK